MKSVPVAGGFLDEVIFEQFDSAIDDAVSGMDEDRLDQLLAQFDESDPSEVAEIAAGLSEEQRLAVVPSLIRCVLQSQHSSSEVRSKLEFVEDQLEALPSIHAIVQDIRASIGDASRLEATLVGIERRRSSWVQRISANQRLLLRTIPEEYTPISRIWHWTKTDLPECGYKEFRFRLHELEWLGLIGRTKIEGEWWYAATGEGKTVATESAE